MDPEISQCCPIKVVVLKGWECIRIVFGNQLEYYIIECIKGWGYKVTCIRKSTYKLKEKAKDVYEYMSGN